MNERELEGRRLEKDEGEKEGRESRAQEEVIERGGGGVNIR